MLHTVFLKVKNSFCDGFSIAQSSHLGCEVNNDYLIYDMN